MSEHVEPSAEQQVHRRVDVLGPAVAALVLGIVTPLLPLTEGDSGSTSLIGATIALFRPGTPYRALSIVFYCVEVFTVPVALAVAVWFCLRGSRPKAGGALVAAGLIQAGTSLPWITELLRAGSAVRWQDIVLVTSFFLVAILALVAGGLALLRRPEPG